MNRNPRHITIEGRRYDVLRVEHIPATPTSLPRMRIDVNPGPSEPPVDIAEWASKQLGQPFGDDSPQHFDTTPRPWRMGVQAGKTRLVADVIGYTVGEDAPESL